MSRNQQQQLLSAEYADAGTHASGAGQPDGSQSNREQLYRRFKKINLASENGLQGTRSQTQLNSVEMQAAEEAGLGLAVSDRQASQTLLVQKAQTRYLDDFNPGTSASLTTHNSQQVPMATACTFRSPQTTLSAASTGNYSAVHPAGHPALAQTQHPSSLYSVPFQPNQQAHGSVRNHETMGSLNTRGLDGCRLDPPQLHTLPESLHAQGAYHAGTPHQEAATRTAGHIGELDRADQVVANPYQNVPSRGYASGRGNLLYHRAQGSGGSQYAAHPSASVQSDMDAAPFNADGQILFGAEQAMPRQPGDKQLSRSLNQKYPASQSDAAYSQVGPASHQTDSSFWLNEDLLNGVGEDPRDGARRAADGSGEDSQLDPSELQARSAGQNGSVTTTHRIQKLYSQPAHPSNLDAEEQRRSSRPQLLQAQHDLARAPQKQSFGLIHGQKMANSGFTFSQKNFLSFKNALPLPLPLQQPSPSSVQHAAKYTTSVSSQSALQNPLYNKLNQSEVHHDRPHLKAQGQRVLLSEKPNYLTEERSQDGGPLSFLSTKVPRDAGECRVGPHEAKANFFDIGKVSGRVSHRTNPYTQQLTSHLAGSTAPSHNHDRMTASHVNSCSQFLLGGVAGARPATCATYPTGAGNTLENTQVHMGTGGTINPDTAEHSVERDSASLSHQSQQHVSQVARTLLAQVKPGILKLIQSKIEAIVHELCEEGLQDEQTILRVVEQRAGQFFPRNYQQYLNTNGSMISSSSCGQLTSQAPNSHLFTDCFSASDGTMQMNHLGNPASALNAMSTIERGSTEDLLELRAREQQELAAEDRRRPSEFEMTEEELIQKRTMEAIIRLGHLRQASSHDVARFGVQGAGQREADGVDGGDQQVVAQLIELAECFPSHQMEGEQQQLHDPVYMRIDAPDEETGDLDAYPQAVRQGQVYPSRIPKKNLASRAPQKSDDFKVTFAYTSNQSSIDDVQRVLVSHQQADDAAQLMQQPLDQMYFQQQMQLQSLQQSQQLALGQEQSHGAEQLSQQQRFQQQLFQQHLNSQQQPVVHHEHSPDAMGMSNGDRLWQEMANSERLHLLDSQGDSLDQAREEQAQPHQREHMLLQEEQDQPQMTGSPRVLAPWLAAPGGDRPSHMHSTGEQWNPYAPSAASLSQGAGSCRKMATQNSDLVQHFGADGLAGAEELYDGEAVQPEQLANTYAAQSQEYLATRPQALTASGNPRPPYAIQHKAHMGHFEDGLSSSTARRPASRAGKKQQAPGGTARSRGPKSHRKPAKAGGKSAKHGAAARAPRGSNYDVDAEGSLGVINIKQRDLARDHGDQDQDMVGHPRGVTYVTHDAGSNAATARSRDRQYRTLNHPRSSDGPRAPKSTERRVSKSRSTNRGTRKRDQAEWRDTTLDYDRLLKQLNKKSFKLKMSKSLRKRALFAESTTRPMLQECVMTIRNGRVMNLSPSPLSQGGLPRRRLTVAYQTAKSPARRLTARGGVLSRDRSKKSFKERAASPFRSIPQTGRSLKRLVVATLPHLHLKRTTPKSVTPQGRSARRLLTQRHAECLTSQMQTSRRDRTVTPETRRGLASEALPSRVTNAVRRASHEARVGLKAAYRRQVEQLKGEFGEQLKEREQRRREEARFQRRTTDLHRQRANAYKATLKELERQVQGEKERDHDLAEWASRHSPARTVRFRRRGLQRSFNQLSRSQSFAQRSSFFGLGLTAQNQDLPNTTTANPLMRQRGTHCPGYRGGFSFISKSLPRNNHHFVGRRVAGAHRASKRSLFNDLHRISRCDNRATPAGAQGDEQLINIQNTPIGDDGLWRSRSRSTNTGLKTTQDDWVQGPPRGPYPTMDQDQPNPHAHTPNQSALSNHNAGCKEQLTGKSNRRSGNSKNSTREYNLGWKGELGQSQAVSSVHECNAGAKGTASQGLSSVHDCNQGWKQNLSQCLSSVHDCNLGCKERSSTGLLDVSGREDVYSRAGLTGASLQSRHDNTGARQQCSKQTFGCEVVPVDTVTQSSLEEEFADSKILFLDQNQENSSTHFMQGVSTAGRSRRSRSRPRDSTGKMSFQSSQRRGRVGSSHRGHFSGVSRVAGESYRRTGSQLHGARGSSRGMGELNLSGHHVSRATDRQADAAITHVSGLGETADSWKGETRASGQTGHTGHKDETLGGKGGQLGYQPWRRAGAREDSANTDVSWTSSDLDQEFLDAKLKGRNSQASFTTKLTKYSSELMLNKQRLIQIQKILYTGHKDSKGEPKRGKRSRERATEDDPYGRQEMPRSRSSRGGRGNAVGTNHSSIMVSLPQILENLKQSRDDSKRGLQE